MKFTKKQIDRYSRQIILKKVGVVGQKKLLKSSVLIVGAGGLGSPIAIYLTALGIGKIGIVDKDNVCLLYTSPSPRDATLSRMPSSA